MLTVSGIGDILGLTIMMEAGEIRRFERVGNYASYCRCVDSKRLSNGEKKGKGNAKNGNKYLAWAYVEAANFAVRHNPLYEYGASQSLPPASGNLLVPPASGGCRQPMPRKHWDRPGH